MEHPDRTPPTRRPRHLVLLEGVALFAAYGAIALWWLWPLPSQWTDHSAYAGDTIPVVVADFHFITWSFAWGAHALIAQPLHPFAANAFYPAPLPLAFSDHCFGSIPVFAPMYYLTGNPVLAVNVFIFLTYPLAAIAAYALARRWVGRPAAAVCGLVYAFYPLRLEGIVHFHHLGIHYIPLLFLFTERWLERARIGDAIALAVCFALQTLSSFYVAYTVALGYGAYLIAAAIRWRGALDRRRVLGLMATLAIAALPVIVTAIPYLKLSALGIIPHYGEGDTPLAIGLVPFFAALRTWEYLSRNGPPPICYALAALALLPSWRGRGWPLAVGLQLVLLGVLLCFGSGIYVAGHDLWSPYQLLMKVVPGLSTVRLPIRFHVLAQLGFALLAALGVERVARAVPALSWAVAGLAIALVLWPNRGIPSPPLHEEVVPPNVPPVYSWLARRGERRALLELPGGGFVPSAHRMFMSTYHWLPIVDGYSSYGSRMPRYVQWLASGLPREASLQRLVDEFDIGWLLVHLDELDDAGRARWQPPYPPGLEPVDVPDSPHELLFRVTRAPVDDRRARMISTTETPDGLPLAPLAGPCPGELRLVGPPAQPWKPNTDVSLAFEAVNRSAQSWPAFGFFPRHLIRARARLLQGGKPRGDTAEAFFGNDVPAAGTARAYGMLHTFSPGDYTLEIWLAQGEDGSLETCGVARVEIPITLR